MRDLKFIWIVAHWTHPAGARPRRAAHAARPSRRGDRIAALAHVRLLHLLTTAAGTKRTCRHVRYLSAFRGKAVIGDDARNLVAPQCALIRTGVGQSGDARGLDVELQPFRQLQPAIADQRVDLLRQALTLRIILSSSCTRCSDSSRRGRGSSAGSMCRRHDRCTGTHPRTPRASSARPGARTGYRPI